MNYKQIVDFWLANADQETKQQIAQLDKLELEDSFSQELEFGTAGIRGKMGPGTNRLNIYKIIEVTYGYAKYLRTKFSGELRVVIGTDNRKNRDIFLKAAIGVLTSIGIEVYSHLIVPTPFISYAIRHLKANGGIIITASHNPSEYNGYKVYDNEGAQLLPSETRKISNFLKERQEYLTYRYKTNPALSFPIPSELFTKYVRDVIRLIPSSATGIKVAFSPQHGTSYQLMPTILNAIGCEVVTVTSQMEPLEDFRNTLSPNPEELSAYVALLECAKNSQADIAITTDPDADRIGVAAKKNGDFKVFSGNEFATLILGYLIKQGHFDTKSFVVGSNVSTKICQKMCEKHNLIYVEVPTGFKYVANAIKERKGRQKFLFGFEESFGCLLDDRIARDKDSFQAAVVVSQLASKLKKEGKSLWDYLEEIYKEYGYYYNSTTNIFFGSNHADKEAFMAFVLELWQPQGLVSRSSKKEFLASGIIKLVFEDSITFYVRSSGTEPKVKIYAMTDDSNQEVLEKRKVLIVNLFNQLKEEKLWKH